MKNVITILAFGSIFLTGCQNIDTSKIVPPYSVSLYSKGSELTKISVPADSKLEQKITSFLQNNQTGWKPSFVTYAPSLMIYGEKFSLLLDDNGPVLNYWPQKNKNFQGTKLNSPEMQKLKNALLELMNKNL